MSGKKPCKIGGANLIDNDREIVRLILEKYKSHPCILAIVQSAERIFKPFLLMRFLQLQPKMLHGRKSTGLDLIPPKSVRLASDELASPLTKAVNCVI